MHYDYNISRDRRDYSRQDIALEVEGGKTIKLYKDPTNRLFEAQIYPDFLGLNQNKPNGLIQTEASKAINISTVQKQMRGFLFLLAQSIGSFQYIKPNITFSKIEEHNAEVIKTERTSRHFHDLAIMMHTDVVQQALADKELYEAIIHHRRYYTKMRGVDYDLLRPVHINFYPPAESLEAFKSDYREMLENMIYGEAPSETELFELMNELVQRFRNS